MDRRGFFGVLAAALFLPRRRKTPREELIEKIRRAIRHTKFQPPLKGEKRIWIVLDEFGKVPGGWEGWT